MLPVLVTFFNRPGLLRRVLESISNTPGVEVFFASDGPRNFEDRNNLEYCWELVDSYFPKTPVNRKLMRRTNLGCRRAMTENIAWFFDLVPYGVILEDDCLPNPTFFKLQNLFLQDLNIAKNFVSISGSKVNLFGEVHTPFTAHPSLFPMVWGWGTWAKTWDHYQPEILDAEEITARVAKKLFPLKNQWLERVFFESTFNSRFREVNIGYIDTWDYALTATAWRKNLFSLHLSANTIINIGFNSQGTHTVLNAPNWVPTEFGNISTSDKSVGDWDLSLDAQIAKTIYRCDLTDFTKNKIKKVLIR